MINDKIKESYALSVEEFQDQAMHQLENLWARVRSEDKEIYEGFILRICCCSDLKKSYLSSYNVIPGISELYEIS